MADKVRVPKLETAEEIRRVLRVTVRELRQRKIDPKTANSIVYALKLAKELLEIGEIENRLARLEEIVNQLQDGGNGYEVQLKAQKN